MRKSVIQIKKLDDLSKIQRGASPRPISSKKWYDETNKNVGWVRIGDVTKSSKYLSETEDYFSEEGIKIIRVGLQPDDELCSEGNILAGPFHPSMGELVQSYLLRKQLTPQIIDASKQNGEAVLILCPRKLESKLRGIRNGNLHYWSLLVAPNKLLVKSADVNEIKIICVSSNDLE